jgi:selenide,water dikinase
VAVALTSLSHGAGCGCKIPAADLAPVLARLPLPSDPAVLVGASTADDAGVYRLRDDLALVQTVDFFTPIVDDPYTFGRIAATNALSDVYAMGATPITALNLVAFSLPELGGDVLAEILRGGGDAAAEAGVAVIGGHSIDDAEPKYGMAVTGVVHPDELVTNAGGRAGDALVLTKPLGAGAATTAKRRRLEGAEAALAAAVTTMVELNAAASIAAREAGAHALTDVTGFGLLGHLHELALASGVAAEVAARDVPALPGVLALLEDDAALAGGSRRNRDWAERFTRFDGGVPEVRRRLACDAMTSGGLLVALPPERAAGVPGAQIGRLVPGEPGAISLVWS